MHLTIPASDSQVTTLRAARATAAPGAALVKSILCCGLFFVVSAAHAAGMVSIKGSKVNMRAGSGPSHPVLWELSRGYPLTVIGQQGQWLKVRDFENDEGWVFRTLTAKVPHHIVKAKVANIRSGPGTKYRVLGKAKYGELLRTEGKRGSWAKVRHENGVKGWVSRGLLWGW